MSPGCILLLFYNMFILFIQHHHRVFIQDCTGCLYNDGVMFVQVRMCGAGIAAIKYNLDGDLVAGASTNGSIYLYRVSRCGVTCLDT